MGNADLENGEMSIHNYTLNFNMGNADLENGEMSIHKNVESSFGAVS